MKKFLLLLVVASLVALGVSQAFASASHARIQTKLSVVMKDPGCHWLSLGGKNATVAKVKGSVALLNVDEATLKIVGPTGTTFDKVGKTIVLGKGTYKIVMVGQAPDDNHLKLVVY